MAHIIAPATKRPGGKLLFLLGALLLPTARCTVYPTGTGYTSTGYSGYAPAPDAYGAQPVSPYGAPVYGGPVYAAPPPAYYTPLDPYQQGGLWNQGGWPQGGGWRGGNQDWRGDNSGPPQRDFGGQRQGGYGDWQPGGFNGQQGFQPSPGPHYAPQQQGFAPPLHLFGGLAPVARPQQFNGLPRPSYPPAKHPQ